MTYSTLAMILYAIGIGVLAIATVLALRHHRKPLPLLLIAMAWIYAAGFVVRLAKEHPYDYMSEPIIEAKSEVATDPMPIVEVATVNTMATRPPTIEEDLATIRAAEIAEKTNPGTAHTKLARIRAGKAAARIAASKKRQLSN